MLTTGRGKIGDWPVKIDAGNTYSFHTQIKIQGRKVRAAEPRNSCLKFRSSAWERAGWVRATELGKKIWEPSSCVARSLNGNEKTDRRKNKTSREKVALARACGQDCSGRNFRTKDEQLVWEKPCPAPSNSSPVRVD
jgi:hypothetical protein